MHVCPEGYLELSRADAASFKFAENDLLTISSTNGSIQINWNAKSFTSYSAVSNNIYRSTDLPARYDVLYSNANGSYKLVKPDQKKYVFDASGRLVAAVNPHGQTVNILYTSASSQQPVQI